MSFYKTKEFKAVQKEWKDKLSKSGFKDHEDDHGNLLQMDRRTIAFENRLVLQDFFMRLDAYLTNTKDVPAKHRQILELYSQGVHIKGKDSIVSRVGLSDRTIRYIIKRYKDMLIG